MPNTIEEQVCDAIDVLVDKRISKLQFDKTVRATIKSVEDASIGKYLVQYQDSIFYAYSDPDKSYKVGAQVYIQIPSNDFSKTKTIIGSVKKLGVEYLTAVSAEQRMTKIGTNILTSKKQVNFCSYDENSSQELLTDYVGVITEDLDVYKVDSEYFMIGMTVQTALPSEQQGSGGNYGIKVQAEYYTAAQRESLGDDRTPVTRTYILDVNNMLGQPYKYLQPSQQSAIFTIDGKNLKSIKSIKAFCEGFPHHEEGHEEDIFLSDFQVFFMQPLSDTELSTSSLKILTPYGSYFTSDNDDTKYLEAELKLKGKKVNFNEQNVDFYWFIKDTSITASDKLYYSAYAGQGWRCLNQAQTHDEITQFVAEGYRKHIMPSLAPAAVNTFKCVAVYNDTFLSASIKIQNKVNDAPKISITSSAGTKFYFDNGITTLTCEVIPVKQNYIYYWGHRNKDGILIQEQDRTDKITAIISQSTDFVTYECTVYQQETIIGSAEIVLTNGTPQNEYVLVINDGTKVFKYDEYGVSPASNATAAADRITISTLTFDIYNDQGQVVTPMSSGEKEKLCDIKWVWPDKDYTMLELKSGTLTPKTIVNPTTNQLIYRQVLEGSATLTYGIKNRYDINATDNNIRLEVSFQGHNLVASTNFTFVKQGQLGTNGTKYITRIVPNPSTGVVEEYYLQNNGNIIGWHRQLEKKYNDTTGKTSIEEKYIFQEGSNAPFKVEVWDGAETARKTIKTGANTWKILDAIDIVKDSEDNKNHFKKIAPNISIDDKTGVISVKKSITASNYTPVSTIIQATVTSNAFSELAKNYYATYPLTVAKVPAGEHAIVTGGFKECMFNSDGTRSSFDTKPFALKIFKADGTVINPKAKWEISWTGQIKEGTSVTISPPGVFDSERTNNYIVCTYGNNYKIIVSINFYLNRYGMAAMNDWDGTSIKINNKEGGKDGGGQYILAPQIGAGTKDTSNRFTGITMGKSFGVNGDNTSSQIGLMGFKEGERSIFLDAKTGKAIFGTSGSSQIVISPERYGSAPRGSIYSANYWKWDKPDGTPRAKTDDEKIADEKSEDEGGTGIGNGLLIDLVTPRIRFGSGNFYVQPNGYIHAGGGGDIASWQITNDYLRSKDSSTTLYATNTDLNKERSLFKKILVKDKNNREVFKVYNDGTFAADNGRFKVQQNGNIIARLGEIAGWKISRSASTADGQIKSSSGNTVLHQNGLIECSNLQASSTGHIGGWLIGTDTLSTANGGNITMSSRSGKISGKNGVWQINSDGTAKFTNVEITGDQHTSTLSWGRGKFQVHDDGSMYAYSGNIGKWKLSTDGFTSEDGTSVVITPNGGLKLGNSFSVSSGGTLTASDGHVGGWGIGQHQLKAGNTILSDNGTITCSNLIATNTGKIGNWSISEGSLIGNGSVLSTSGLTTSGTLQVGGNASVSGYVNASGVFVNSVQVVTVGSYSGSCSVTVDGVTYEGSCSVTLN